MIGKQGRAREENSVEETQELQKEIGELNEHEELEHNKDKNETKQKIPQP